jgi:hypothetical protein
MTVLPRFDSWVFWLAQWRGLGFAECPTFVSFVVPRAEGVRYQAYPDLLGIISLAAQVEWEETIYSKFAKSSAAVGESSSRVLLKMWAEPVGNGECFSSRPLHHVVRFHTIAECDHSAPVGAELPFAEQATRQDSHSRFTRGTNARFASQ